MTKKEFYSSKAWKICREGYKRSIGGLCERCAKKGLIVPADVVHHKVYISPENIGDPAVTLNWNNLEALCWSCHEAEHKGIQRRYEVDAIGHVVSLS